MNENKTLIIYLGPWKQKNENPLGFCQEGDCFNVLGVFVGRDERKKMEMNFQKKIDKMTATFNFWQTRNISLLGKMNIVKSLGMSNLVYSLSNTNCSNHLLEKAHKAINQFVWNKKPPRIKHSSLIMNIESGGMGMPDIKCINKALRLAWIARILENGKWCRILNNFLRKYGGFEFLLKCNFDCKYLSNIPHFYLELFKYARNIIFPDKSEYIIWNNKEVLIENSPQFWKTWYLKGIIYISDLWKSDRWLTLTEVREKYDIDCNYLQYYSLIDALKPLRNRLFHVRGDQWYNLQTPVNDQMYNMPTILKDINLRTARCKDYYPICLEFDIEPPIAMQRWFTQGVQNDTYINSMIYAKTCTKETKLLSLQFKIINNIWPVRAKLYDWKIVDSRNCIKCGKIDDVFHAFCQCPETLSFLQDVFNYIDPTNQIKEQLTLEGFIFGINEASYNHLFLIIKSYIAQCRNNDEKPNLRVLQCFIYKRILSEKMFQCNFKFSSKWSGLEWLILESENYARHNCLQM